MKEKNKIIQSIASIFLLIILMLPSIVQVSHQLEEEHKICGEVKTHFHQEELACEICDFQFFPFSYKTLEIPEFLINNIPSKTENLVVVSVFKSHKLSDNQLRGPPYFLV